MAGSSSTSDVKLACTIFMCMLVATPHTEAAITCSDVSGNLTPCMPYLKAGGIPTEQCCTGVQSLNSMASTPADRKDACMCLKSMAGSIIGINYQAAKELPGKCNVNIPYPISLSTDCSTLN